MEPFLDRILNILNKHQDNDTILHTLQSSNMLVHSFDISQIINLVDFEFYDFNLCKITEDYCVCYMNAKDGLPYKFEFAFYESWQLKSILFLCQSCFGTENDCQVCGGGGWGVL